MRRTKQVLAVVVVATALCADHVASAAPVGPVTRAQPGLAVRLVGRLSRVLRQTVPSAVAAQVRQPRPASSPDPRRPADQSVGVAGPPLSPFQFRLPPPAA